MSSKKFQNINFFVFCCKERCLESDTQLLNKSLSTPQNYLERSLSVDFNSEISWNIYNTSWLASFIHTVKWRRSWSGWIRMRRETNRWFPRRRRGRREKFGDQCLSPRGSLLLLPTSNCYWNQRAGLRTLGLPRVFPFY